MSADQLAPCIDSRRLNDSLAELCVGQEEAERFLAGVCEQLVSLSAELARRQTAYLAERDDAANDLAQRAARLDRERAELATEREELAQARAALTELRGQIACDREELAGLRAKPAAADTGLMERLGEMEKSRDELLEERTALEAELESVRGRAADLAESLSTQRQELATERAQWTDELKRMRRLMEKLIEQARDQAAAARAAPPADAPSDSRSARVSDPAEALPDCPNPAPDRSSQVPGPPVSAAPARSTSSDASAGDPVLESVMAQFEMLQKDLARRRKVKG